MTDLHHEGGITFEHSRRLSTGLSLTQFPRPANVQEETRSHLNRVICMDYAEKPIAYPSMRSLLEELEHELPEMLMHERRWSDVVIDASPALNRLYCNWRPGLRVCLHRIDPCVSDQLPVLHFHQWPSIMKIHKGGYKQALAFGDTAGDTPPICATVDIGPGAIYEMVHPNLWHAPIPGKSPSWSTMISAMGTWRTPMKDTPLTRDLRLPRLSPEDRSELFAQFRSFYPGSEGERVIEHLTS